MSWDQLELELAEMFGEYTDREYERQMSVEWWATERFSVRRANQKLYRANNKGFIRQIKRNYREQNIEAVRKYHREYARKWRADNADKARAAAREQQRKRRARNPEEHREYQRRWRAENREHDNARQRERRLARKSA
jgi:hypothetical protein